MIIIFALLTVAALTAQNRTELDIRTGISQLQLGTLTYASYTILFKSNLPDNSYNSLVSLSYVSNLNLANGIDITSICPNITQSSLLCSIQSKNPSQYNILYVSYVASDYGSLLVGTHPVTFDFANINQISREVVFDPQANKDYINSNNGLYVNLYSFVAGLSSLDPDFQLSLSNPRFDGLTALVSIDITISEMHAKNITIIFGYILYDVTKAKVGFYEGERLQPGNIALGYIYGITNIKSMNTTKAPTPPKKRLLQILERSAKSVGNIYNPIKTIDSSTIQVTDPVNILPTSYKRSTVETKSTKKPAAAAALAVKNKPKPNPSPGDMLRNKAINRGQLKLKHVAINSEVFNTFCDSDGVLDTNQTMLNTLRQSNFFAAPVATKAAAAMSAPNSANQLFNSLFSTNGFMITTTADDVDQIYYYEVSPVTNMIIPAKAESIVTPSYYQSIISNAPITYPTSCSGVLISIIDYNDFIQKGGKLGCLLCSKETQYLNYKLKICEKFPKIKGYLNLYDTIK